MSKPTREMLSQFQDLEDQGSSSSSKPKNPNSYFPPTARALPGELGDLDYKSVFIDTLTTHDEFDQPIPGAKEKVQIMRDMRFKPATLYREQNTRDQHLQADPSSPYFTTNGVRFLKPMEDPNAINFQKFTKESRVKVIENRTVWESFKRGVSMFFQSLTVAGLVRLFAKTKQILPGTFGYAMNMDGDIEVYPASTDRRIGLSIWTDIKVSSITDPYVNIFDRIHLVNVPEGKYATAMKDRFPVFLPPGRHIIESIDFKLTLDNGKPKFVDINTSLIKNGDSYIIRVPQGSVAFGDLSGQPKVFEPEHGVYVFHDPTFKLVNEKSPFEDIGKKLVGDKSPVRVVTVKQTHALISNENGQLHIHRGGRHPLVNANHVCEPDKPNQEFDLTQQNIKITSKDEPGNNNNSKQNNTEKFISQDGVQLQVESVMLFKVKDVEKCIKDVGADDYKKNITARALHILRELLSSTTYLHKQDFQAKISPPSASTEMVVRDAMKAEDQLHKNLGNKLREELQRDLDKEGGIELHDVLITSLLPESQKLRDSIESNAGVIAEAHRETTKSQLTQTIARTNADTDRMIATIKAQQAAEVLTINTQAVAEAKKVELAGAATATASALVIKTDAELHIVTRTAEINAAATIKTATAKKEAHLLEAEGLKAYDDTGRNLQLLHAQAAVSKGLLQGAEVKLIGSDVGNVGNMIMSSMAGMFFTGKPGTHITPNDVRDADIVHSLPPSDADNVHPLPPSSRINPQ